MKHLKKFEDIIIPINIGDVIYGGRFKNKKTIVKKIGKNKKGDITINDKPLLKFRLKESNNLIYTKMKHLKKFNEHSISIFSQEWKKLLPECLNLITHNGRFDLNKTDLILNGDLIQIPYYQNTVSKSNDPLSDGEPDYLEIDIHLVKVNDGKEANPDTLKLNVDITYGDAMMSEFTIEAPNKVKVNHYTSFNSLYDKETIFAFDDTTITDLVNLFNRMSNKFKLTKDDFKFLDKDPNSYKPNLTPQ